MLNKVDGENVVLVVPNGDVEDLRVVRAIFDAYQTPHAVRYALQSESFQLDDRSVEISNSWVFQFPKEHLWKFYCGVDGYADAVDRLQGTIASLKIDAPEEFT